MKIYMSIIARKIICEFRGDISSLATCDHTPSMQIPMHRAGFQVLRGNSVNYKRAFNNETVGISSSLGWHHHLSCLLLNVCENIQVALNSVEP